MSEFRVTAWPEKLFLPEVWKGVYTLAESRSALIVGGPETWYVPGGETYLALCEFDPETPEKILEFANTHAHLDGAEMCRRLDAANLVPRSYPNDEALQLQQKQLIEDAPVAAFQESELLEHFRYAARLLRDLTS